MTTTLEAALSRLRNADPADATPADALETAPHARAMLTQILGAADDRSLAEPNRARRRRIRRLALAGALAAAVVVTAVAGVIPMPWSHGQASSAAYAVTEKADGTVDVTVRWSQLHNPDALNARLRRAGVRAGVMLYSAPGACRTPVAWDRAHTIMPLDMRQHPEFANDRRGLIAYLRSLEPWIDYHPQRSGDRNDVSVFTIHPDAIPSGDQLLILPRWDRPQGATTDALELRSLIVLALPHCVPSPEDSVLTSNGIEPR